jgi:hypothetical protein
MLSTGVMLGILLASSANASGSSAVVELTLNALFTCIGSATALGVTHPLMDMVIPSTAPVISNLFILDLPFLGS